MRLRRRWAWLVVGGWVLLVVAMGGLSGKLGGVEKNDAAAWLPADAESTRVVAAAKPFVADDVYPAVVVYDRGGAPLGAQDLAQATADAGSFARLGAVTGEVVGPVRSQDGKALRTVVPIHVGRAGVTDVLPTVKHLRSVIRGRPLRAHVTGPAGYGADSADAFSGVSSTLLYLTVGIVVVILLLTYRSPVLWLLPLICVGAALTVAEALIYLLAAHAGLTVNSDSEFLLTVLVFGAGTDYALLLIARYRDELSRRPDRFEAMGVALRRSGPAILASGGTVVLSLLCLSVAQLTSTRGLGPVMAVGVAVAFCAMTTLLPALLVVCGRWVLWPMRQGGGRRWERLGALLARRPRVVWLTAAGVLVVMAFGLTGLKADGLQNKDSFRGATDASVGEQVLARHFPAGSGDPLEIVGPASAAGDLYGLARATPGIADVTRPRISGELAYLEATSTAVTGSRASFHAVDALRARVHTVPRARVGGDSAILLDTIRASRHDRDLVVPLVLAVVFLILCLLLRALVAPVVLLATVVLSLAATLGASALIFDHLFGFAGSDAAFPLWAFVFLISLGIDYTIFLMSRVREEASRGDTRQAAVRALGSTGGTITAAGVVLAGTFAALTTLPLVFAVEIGFVVAFGVLLDTFVVRSVLVTALVLDLGDRVWWPRPARQPAPVTSDRMNVSAS